MNADGQEAPVCRAHVTDDAEAWLSLDCSVNRIFGNSEAVRILDDLIAVMREKVVPFAPGMSFEEMMQAMGRMTLREVLSERQIETDRFGELDAALRRIPNI